MQRIRAIRLRTGRSRWRFIESADMGRTVSEIVATLTRHPEGEVSGPRNAWFRLTCGRCRDVWDSKTKLPAPAADLLAELRGIRCPACRFRDADKISIEEYVHPLRDRYTVEDGTRRRLLTEAEDRINKAIEADDGLDDFDRWTEKTQDLLREALDGIETAKDHTGRSVPSREREMEE